MASGDELRDSVAELLASRYGEVETEREFGGKRVDIYFVESRSTGRRRIAVECKDYKDTLGVDLVERILVSYDRLLRAGSFDEYWIVTRKPLTSKARELLRNDPNVHAITFDTLQRNIFDVANYVRAIQDDFVQSGLGQYYIESTDDSGKSVLTEIMTWLDSDTSRPLAVLAGYGMGKSSLARYIAYKQAKEWLQNPTARIPILIELAEFSRQQRLEGVVSSLLAADYNVPGFHFHTFMQLNRAGRFLTILDGFDEMKHCMTIDEFTYNWRQICRLATGRSKVVLFGRPSIFTSDDELTLFLHGSVKTDSTILTLPDAPNFLTEELSFFTKSEASEFIRRYATMLSQKLGSNQVSRPSIESFHRRTAQIEALDYDELLKRPIHAKLVCDVALGNPTTDLAAFGKYELYDQVVRRLCSREDEKIGRLSTGVDRRVDFSRHLAWWAWIESKHAGFTASELPSELVQRFSVDHRSLNDGSRRELLASAAVDTKRSLRYHFPHRSILEFLVADCAINAMEFTTDATKLSESLNNEIALFLQARRNNDFAARWLEELKDFRGSLSLKFISTIISILEKTTPLKERPGQSGPWRRKMNLVSAFNAQDSVSVIQALNDVTRQFSEIEQSPQSGSFYSLVKTQVDPELASFMHTAIVLYGLSEPTSELKQPMRDWILRTILQFSEVDDFLDLIRQGVRYDAPTTSRVCSQMFSKHMRFVNGHEGAIVVAELPGITKMAAEHGERVGLLSDISPTETNIRTPLENLLEALPTIKANRYRQFQKQSAKRLA